MKKLLVLATVMLPVLIVSCSKDKSESPDESVPGEIQSVDLGLSVMWGDRNLGAASPSDYGKYYAWGETEAKSVYTWESYKWCNGSYTTLMKYNTDNTMMSYGIVDNRIQLVPEDDVACVKLGGGWRIPTQSEIDELIATKDDSSYKWVWKSIKGHEGWQITYLLNNKSIFLPAADKWNEYLPKFGWAGYYWASSIVRGIIVDEPNKAWCLYFDSEEVDRYGYNRSDGCPVRPVID